MQSFDFRIEDDRSSQPDRAKIPANDYLGACELAEKMVHDHPHYRRIEVYSGSVWVFAASRTNLKREPLAQP